MSDFTTVTKSRKGKSKSPLKPEGSSPREVGPVDEDLVKSQLQKTKDDLASSEYWKNVKETLGSDTFEVLACLGLGQVSHSVTSRWQAAMLLLLKDQLKSRRCVAYDPLFAEADRRILEFFDVEPLHENDEGRLSFSKSRTLFFMPHCGRPLFDSVLYANREQLQDIVIYGNSFETMFNDVEFENKMRRGQFPALKQSEQIYEEVELKNVFQYQDVFNDLSIIRFKSALSRDIPDPQYDENDEIILQRQMEQLSLW